MRRRRVKKHTQIMGCCWKRWVIGTEISAELRTNNCPNECRLERGTEINRAAGILIRRFKLQEQQVFARLNLEQQFV